MAALRAVILIVASWVLLINALWGFPGEADIAPVGVKIQLWGPWAHGPKGPFGPKVPKGPKGPWSPRAQGPQRPKGPTPGVRHDLFGSKLDL